MITQSHPFRNRQFSKLRVKLNNFTGLSHSELADFSVNNDGFIKPFHKLSLGLIGSPASLTFTGCQLKGPALPAEKQNWNKFETNIFLAYLTPQLPVSVHKKNIIPFNPVVWPTIGNIYIYMNVLNYIDKQINKQTDKSKEQSFCHQLKLFNPYKHPERGNL